MTQLTENLTVWELWYFKAITSYRGERFQVPTRLTIVTRQTGEYKVDLTRHPKFPLAFGELASGRFPHILLLIWKMGIKNTQSTCWELLHMIGRSNMNEDLLHYISLHYPHMGWGPSWSWSYGSWIYNYLCNQCLSPLKLWVWTPFMTRWTR
jgi:hypothetical protein